MDNRASKIRAHFYPAINAFQNPNRTCCRAIWKSLKMMVSSCSVGYCIVITARDITSPDAACSPQNPTSNAVCTTTHTAPTRKWSPLRKLTNHTDHHVQAFVLPSLILEAPHPVRLLVPICARRAVHPPPPNMRLSIGSRRFVFRIARGDRCLAFCHGWQRALLGRSRPVQRRRRHEVLDDGAVDRVLIGWGSAGGRGLGDQGFEDRVLGDVRVSIGAAVIGTVGNKR